MEPLFEYFYEIQGFSLLAAFGVSILGGYVKYNLRGRKNLLRVDNQSPLWLRIKSRFNNTKIGKWNLKSHIMWENFRNKYADKVLFYSKEKNSIKYVANSFYAIMMGCLIGYTAGEYLGGFRRHSWYYIKYGEYNPKDKVKMYLKALKDPNYTNHILYWELQNKIHSDHFDGLDYIEFGKLMSGVLQEEIAFQCYYIAHLKDPDNIKTNADLNFDTLLLKAKE